jgi:hypothetical protein
MRLSVRYDPLDELQGDERNPREHDTATTMAGLGRFGYAAEAIAVDERTGKLVAGHGRVAALRALQEAGAKPPANVRTRAGRWLVPVQHGWSSKDDAQALFAIVALNAGERAGFDDAKLLGLLERIEGDGFEGLGFDQEALDDIRARIQETLEPDEPAVGADFTGRQVRSIILEYVLADFTYLTETAAGARAEYKADSNAELFLAMLEAWDAKVNR